MTYYSNCELHVCVLLIYTAARLTYRLFIGIRSVIRIKHYTSRGRDGF